MKRQAEDMAREIIRELQISFAPIDVYHIAQDLKLNVIEEELPEEVSGVLYQNKQKTPVIILNKQQSSRRKRFSVAHEIGHYVLKHQTDIHVDKKLIFRDAVSSAAIDSTEIDANTFAAELLMPAELVKRSYQTLLEQTFDDEDELLAALASEYDVSTAAMGFRLKNLGFSIA
jgi:Zn-dependent peptidase ImmA (M78 family)